MVFEVFPDYLPAMGLGAVGRQLETLQRLWDRRGRSARRPAAAGPRATPAPAPVLAGPTPEEWEDTLGALVVGRPAAASAGPPVAGVPAAAAAAPRGALGSELEADPGLAVVRELVAEFRAGMVAEALKLTTRLLLASLGAQRVRALLAGWFARVPPALFASEEGEGFAAHLAGLHLEVPFLATVLAYERALLATILDGRTRVVPFPFDPLPVLRALAEGRLPDPALVRVGRFEIELTPPGAAPGGGGDDPALLALAVPQVLHR
jgi:hypothetical protein